MIRAIVETREGCIAEVSLSGDFFFYLADKLETLEATLAGVELGVVEPTIAEFYRREGIESPGVTPAASKGIALDGLEVQVETRVEEAGHQQKTTFVTAIGLGLGLTERELRTPQLG